MDEVRPDLADLVDDPAAASSWTAWLRDHPDAAAEVDAARRVRALLVELQQASIAVPADFQARLMQRIRQDATVLELVDLGLAGLGRAILELLAALFALLPAPQPRPAS